MTFYDLLSLYFRFSEIHDFKKPKILGLETRVSKSNKISYVSQNYLRLLSVVQQNSGTHPHKHMVLH